MEPDWSNVDIVREWLGSRYPNSDNQTGSPMYRYLKDELAKGHKLRGRETHLSKGGGGEFLKWIHEHSGGNAVYYPDIGVTYYPEFKDPPTSDEDNYLKPKRPEKREKAKKKKGNKRLHHPHSAPNLAQSRRTKPPTTDRELMRIQKERLRTLRPRRNGKVSKPV